MTYSVNDNLEATAQAIHKETILSLSSNSTESIYSILSIINGSPFASESFNSNKIGYPLIRIRDLSKCNPDIYTDEVINKMEYVNVGDILIGMDGEFIPHIWYGHTGVLNQRVCKVVPTERYGNSMPVRSRFCSNRTPLSENKKCPNPELS